MVWIGGQRLQLLFVDQHLTRRFEYEFTCHIFPIGTQWTKSGAEFSMSPTQVGQLLLRPRCLPCFIVYIKSISISDI
jgi:hypothetical protein